jgi:broad specificity phosphatase PhoE
VTTFLLVRHASHDLVGKALAGRSAKLHVNEKGRNEARALAEILRALPIVAVRASPQPRAIETAQPIADTLRLEVQVDSALDEIDFGLWTGRTFHSLAGDPLWKTWVEQRSIARPPEGEAFQAVQERIVGCLGRLQRAHPDDVIVLVSHGDVLKAALAHYFQLSLNDLERFELSPASVSVLTSGSGWEQVRVVNWRPTLPV